MKSILNSKGAHCIRSLMNDACDSVIQIHGLTKSYRDETVLKGIDLNIRPKGLTVIIGPSGTGKSTLLRCLNCLETFEKGRIDIGNISIESEGERCFQSRENRKKIAEIRQRVGMVFQSFNLFPHLSVLQNVMKAPQVVRHQSEEESRHTAEKLLAKVGLHSYGHRFPSQLSGGQQQRAAIARALAMAPKVMLYDEPTSALDPGLSEEVFQVMRHLDDDGMTQVAVTHELKFAKELAEDVVFLSDGVVVEHGSPDQIFGDPKDSRTRQFVRGFS